MLPRCVGENTLVPRQSNLNWDWPCGSDAAPGCSSLVCAHLEPLESGPGGAGISKSQQHEMLVPQFCSNTLGLVWCALTWCRTTVAVQLSSLSRAPPGSASPARGVSLAA
ncbi:hypothetical protein M758_12G106200 [Ceratodon purpureus]|nr:hypothetical protein M758_12G106200 [Ceratodon purpureus]